MHLLCDQRFTRRIDPYRFGPLRPVSTCFDQRINPKIVGQIAKTTWVAGASQGCGQIEAGSMCLSMQELNQTDSAGQIAGQNACKYWNMNSLHNNQPSRGPSELKATQSSFPPLIHRFIIGRSALSWKLSPFRWLDS